MNFDSKIDGLAAYMSRRRSEIRITYRRGQLY